MLYLTVSWIVKKEEFSEQTAYIKTSADVILYNFTNCGKYLDWYSFKAHGLLKHHQRTFFNEEFPRRYKVIIVIFTWAGVWLVPFFTDLICGLLFLVLQWFTFLRYCTIYFLNTDAGTFTSLRRWTTLLVSFGTTFSEKSNKRVTIYLKVLHFDELKSIQTQLTELLLTFI